MTGTFLSQIFAYQKYHPIEASEIADFADHLQKPPGMRTPVAFIMFEPAPQQSLQAHWLFTRLGH